MSRLLYLAHPIVALTDEDRTETMRAVHRLRDEFVSRGWIVYTPGYAFRAPAGSENRDVFVINQQALHCAHALLAVLHRSEMSTGVGVELGRWDNTKPCAAIVSGLKLGLPPRVSQFLDEPRAVEWLD